MCVLIPLTSKVCSSCDRRVSSALSQNEVASALEGRGRGGGILTLVMVTMLQAGPRVVFTWADT